MTPPLDTDVYADPYSLDVKSNAKQANPFDQFDPKAANPFDQFDAKAPNPFDQFDINKGAVGRFTTGAALGAGEMLGKGIAGIGGLPAAAETVAGSARQPYYEAYSRFGQMKPEERAALREEINADPSLTELDKTTLHEQLSDVAEGEKPLPLDAFSPHPNPTANPVSKAGEAIAKGAETAFPMTQAEKETWSGRIGLGVGAVAPVAAAGVVNPAVALGVGAALMGGSAAKETYDAAVEKGATPTDAAHAMMQSFTVNTAAGAVDFGAVLRPIERSAPGMMPWAAAKLKQAAQQGVTFTGIGEVQEWLGAQIAKQYYDPEAQYQPDVKRAMTSLFTGAAMGALSPTHGAAEPAETGAKAEAKSEPDEGGARRPAGPAALVAPRPFPDGQGGELPDGSATRDPAVWDRWMQDWNAEHPTASARQPKLEAAEPNAAKPIEEPLTVKTLPQQVLSTAVQSGRGEVLASEFSPVERQMLAEAGIKPRTDEGGRSWVNTAPLREEATARVASGQWDTKLPLDDASHIGPYLDARPQPPVSPSTPEPKADVEAQVAALADPHNPKDAVFVAAGTKLPETAPPHVEEITRPEGTLITDNPQKAEAFQQAPVLTDAHMAEILGLPETKQEAIASGSPRVVQGQDASGHVVAETLASPSGTESAVAAVKEQVPHGGDVRVLTPEEAQARRAQYEQWEYESLTTPEAERTAAPVAEDMARTGETTRAPAVEATVGEASAPRQPTPEELAVAAADVARSAVPPTARPEPQSGEYTSFAPDDLTVQPEIMQYKEAGERGVTGALHGVSRWEPALANPITVWQTRDGRNVVANGHQRLDLALRAQAAGQQDIRIPAKIFRETDGYTPEFMRALGAFQNIAEGSGTAIDAAKVLRAPLAVTEKLRLPDLPPKSALVRDSAALAKLSPEAFRVVENGVVPPEQAAHVGALIHDPTEQMAALDVLARARPESSQQARLMVEDIRNSGFLKGAQTTLFGDESFAQSLVAERSRILDNALTILRRQKNVFRAAVEGEGTLAAAGNKLSREANQQGRTENEQLIERLQRDATKRGELSDRLSEAARILAGNPRALGGATTRFLAAARSVKPERGGEGIPHGATDDGARLASEAGPEFLEALNGDAHDALNRHSVSGSPAQGLARVLARSQELAGSRPPGRAERDQLGSGLSGSGDGGGSEGVDSPRRPPLPPASGAPLFGEPERERRQRAEQSPLMTDKAALERSGQAVLPGMEASARQAQAARDQALPRSGQMPANEGLFAPREAEQKPLFKTGEPSVAALPHPAAVQAMADATQRVVGAHVRIEVYGDDKGGDLAITHPDGRTERVGGVTLGRLIRAAVTDRTQYTLDHEAIHALRNLGVFTPREWAELSATAERENWAHRYNVDRVYPDATPDQRNEEAIAQRFADFAATPPAAHEPFLTRIAAKVQNFMARARNALVGRGFRTADDIFGAVQRGEVGAREPGSGTPQRGPQTIPESTKALERWHETGEVLDRAIVATGKQRDQIEATPQFQKAMAERMGGTVADQKKTASGLVDEVRRWWSPTSREGAKPMEFVVRKGAARLAQATAQSAHALQEFKDAINRLPVEMQLDITHRQETHEAQATPYIQKAMDALVAEQNKWKNKIRSLGQGHLENAVEGYMGHIWSNYAQWAAGDKTPPDQTGALGRAVASAMSKGPLRGSGAFLKQRSFDTMQSGMEAGLIPVTTNPIEMQLMKLREMQKYYHGQRMADEIKQSGLGVWIPTGKEGEANATGLKKLDDTVFQPRRHEDEVFGRIESGNWYAPEPAALIFNRYVSRGIAQQYPSIYNGLRLANNSLNSLQLGISGFHATFVTLDTMMSRLALAMKQVSRGEIGRGAVTAASAPIAVVPTLRKGAALQRAYLSPDDATPEMRGLVNAMLTAGGRSSMDRFFGTSPSGTFFRSLKDLKDPEGPLRDAWQMVKDSPVKGPFQVAARAMDTVMHPLMGVMVPRAKLGVFSDLATDWLRRNPTASEAESAAAMTRFWDSVDNRMGQMVYDNIFWDKTMKDLAFLTTRSVGWNLGTIRELAGAVGDIPGVAKRALSGGTTEITDRMGYAIALPMMTAMMGAILTYVSTEAAPQEMMDYFYPPTGTVTNGVKDRRIIPGYMKDIREYTSAPVQTLLNKTAPLWETLNELRLNKDYYGGIIYDPVVDNPAVAYPEYLLNQVIPFSFRGWMKERASGATMWDQQLAFWGIQPAPASIVNPAKGEAYQARQEKIGLRARQREIERQGRVSLPFFH